MLHRMGKLQSGGYNVIVFWEILEVYMCFPPCVTRKKM